MKSKQTADCIIKLWIFSQPLTLILHQVTLVFVTSCQLFVFFFCIFQLFVYISQLPNDNTSADKQLFLASRSLLDFDFQI